MDGVAFFVSQEFLYKALIPAFVVQLVFVAGARALRVGHLGLTSWVGRLSRRRRREWHNRVRFFARFPEAYELARHTNRTVLNGSNFLYLSGLLFYVGAATLSHAILVILFLIVSVLINLVAMLVDARAGWTYHTLNSAARVRVRREIAPCVGSFRQARMLARAIR